MNTSRRARLGSSTVLTGLIVLAVTAACAATGPTAQAGPGGGAGASAAASAAASASERPQAERGPSRAEKKARRSPRFTLAVVPDTQEEVIRAGDGRFVDRTRWLARNRKDLNLRYVAQTGDLVNWGWLDPAQYAVASSGLRKLERRDIPYSVAVGNHDTRAVGWNGTGGYGGDAYVKNPECAQRFPASECSTPLLVRHTEEFNATFDAQRYGAVKGAFEPGKVDNIYSTFRAGRLRWMVLTLELWPRPEVVEWARQVVASHPRSNVIVSTHSYLDGNGGIYQGTDYGATSPQYLYDHLISVYPNVKMVFSGHVGVAGSRVDTGVNGNTIASFLGTFHSTTTDPVRLLRVNARRDRVTSRFFAPASGETFPEYDLTVEGMAFVR